MKMPSRNVKEFIQLLKNKKAEKPVTVPPWEGDEVAQYLDESPDDDIRQGLTGKDLWKQAKEKARRNRKRMIRMDD